MNYWTYAVVMDCLIMTYRARSRPFEKEECQLRFLRIKGVLEIFCYFYTWKWHFSKKHPPSLDLPLWFAIIIHELRIHCCVSNFCWCHGFPRNGIHYCAPYNKFRLLSHLTYFLKYMILKSVYHNVYKIFCKRSNNSTKLNWRQSVSISHQCMNWHQSVSLSH